MSTKGNSESLETNYQITLLSNDLIQCWKNKQNWQTFNALLKDVGHQLVVGLNYFYATATLLKLYNFKEHKKLNAVLGNVYPVEIVLVVYLVRNIRRRTI